jgi:nitrite reductase (cytochrome c-552)
MTRTRYGGSEAMPSQPSADDPRDVVSASRLEEDPRLIRFWAGYAFAEDFREERGHAYMLSDQVYTRRQDVAKQPGTCIHCHGSVYVPYKKLGGGDLMRGFELANQMPYAEARELVTHPVSCIDCHDPETMQLRITRPGFIAGIRTLKLSQGVEDYDVNRDATRQEMRSYVCGQCHVEYYFEGPEKRLVYPWSKGLKADSILAYYEENGHKDWTHATSAAPVLKAQHPEFELYNQGIHARAGVACADSIQAGGRDENQRPLGSEPPPERQRRLPDVPQMVGRRTHTARSHNPGPYVRASQHCYRCCTPVDGCD